MAKYISCDCKCKLNRKSCNSNQKWNNKTCRCECKNHRTRKKDSSQNPSTCICEKSKYLKSIADTSVIECDEVINVLDNASTKKADTLATKKTSTIATTATSTASINCHSKKVKDGYILHTVLLKILLLY